MKKADLQIYEKLAKSEILRDEEKVFGGIFKRPIWQITADVPDRNFIDKHILPNLPLPLKKGASKRRYTSCLINNIKKARRTKSAQRFECPAGVYGFALPLVQGEKIYGYVVLCNADKKIPDPFLQLFKLSLANVLTEIQKELELTKVCETIRPRAIALSTIHTIHRLISSTLQLDELLPRIARLSIQIMRANRCSIKLLHQNRKVLVSKTTIDLRKNKRIKLKNLPVGKGIPGKAVKLGKAIRGKRYLSVPLIDEEIIGVITVYEKVNEKPFNEFDQEILSTLAEQAAIAIKNAQLYKEQQDVIVGSIKSLAMILHSRSPHGRYPSEVMAKIIVEVGREMDMRQEELRSLEVASFLHDAGQVSVPDEILRKTTRLTGEEFELVKEHPVKSVEILEPLKALKPAIPIIMHHHEKYDGTGYPKGLKGSNIPIGARILAVISAFEAMVAARPYRSEAKTVEEAVEEIKGHSGTQFDPKVVNAFIKVVNKPSIKKLLKHIFL